MYVFYFKLMNIIDINKNNINLIFLNVNINKKKVLNYHWHICISKIVPKFPNSMLRILIFN